MLDESQRIKNRTSATSQAARAIRAQPQLGPDGHAGREQPGGPGGHLRVPRAGVPLARDEAAAAWARTIRDYVLRRTKDQVLADLPPKLFRDAELELSPEQRASYELAEEEGVLRLAAMEQSITIQHVFELVLRLKQICNFDPATGASAKLERLGGRPGGGGRQRAQGAGVQPMGRHARASWPGGCGVSGRWSTTARCPARSATAVIRRFRDDPAAHVLLMSYGAGGVGLNLQFAQYVFLFDRWWNPAVEDQAINRAHRIGVAGAGHGHAVPHAGHDRGADRPHPRGEARAVRHDLLRRRRAPQDGPDAGRAVRAVRPEMPRRPHRPGGVSPQL